MSTRCVVTVIDESHRFSIYRHSDGYPDSEHGVVAQISQALEFAWPLPRFEAMDFAAAIVRAWKESAGNICFTNGPEAHGDLEYQYEVTCKDGVLQVKVIAVRNDWSNDDAPPVLTTLYEGLVSEYRGPVESV